MPLHHEHCAAEQVIGCAATPLGQIGVVVEGEFIVRLLWHAEEHGQPNALSREAKRQLEAYFAGNLTQFELPLAPAGSSFQQRVYARMSAIPYGQTCTYGDIATSLGSAAQPVGQACGSNPIPIIIPCHRVLSARGPGGYSGYGGVETKISLLKHENAWPYLL